MYLLSCIGHIQQELFCKGSVLNIGKDLLHGLFGIFCDDLGTCDIIAVFRCIGDRIPHTWKTGLVDQINDQFHFMDTFKVSVSGIISGFHQCFKACLHQCAYTAAEYCLLSEQVGFRLGTEGSFQHACSGAADTQRISQRHILCLSCKVLLYRYQTGNTLAFLIFAAYRMSRSFGSDHGNIHIGRRYDTSEMDVETMCKHQHIALFQIRRNVLFIKLCLFFIVDQNHNDIGLLCSFCSCKHFKALLLCPAPWLGALIKPDDHMAPWFLQIQRMCMSLTAVSDNCNGLAFQQWKITVLLIINICHFLLLLFPVPQSRPVYLYWIFKNTLHFLRPGPDLRFPSLPAPKSHSLPAGSKTLRSWPDFPSALWSGFPHIHQWSWHGKYPSRWSRPLSGLLWLPL